MGLTITDTLALVSKGYKVPEIQEVSKIYDENKNDNNIIELAKKLAFSDFKSAMTLFTTDIPNGTEDAPEKKQTDNESEDNEVTEDLQDDQGTDDGIDYKKMYETEKKLREDIQKANQSKDVSGDENKESDWDIALRFAQDVLN